MMRLAVALLVAAILAAPLAAGAQPADGPCVASMTPLNLPERMNELSGG